MLVIFEFWNDGRFYVFGDAFPPSSFILEEPGYPKYELWCDGKVRVADVIDGLIESFVRDGCSNKKLESVCMEWDERSGDPSRAPKRLSKPTKIDRPLPDVEMLCSRMPSRQLCEMHSFLNATQWKRMEDFKWSAKSGRGSDRRSTHFLQCLVKDLSG